MLGIFPINHRLRWRWPEVPITGESAWRRLRIRPNNREFKASSRALSELSPLRRFFWSNRRKKNLRISIKSSEFILSALRGPEHDSAVLQSPERVVSGEIKMLFNYCKINCDGKEIGIVIVAFTESLWSFIGLVSLFNRIEAKWEALAIIFE